MLFNHLPLTAKTEINTYLKGEKKEKKEKKSSLLQNRFRPRQSIEFPLIELIRRDIEFSERKDFAGVPSLCQTVYCLQVVDMMPSRYVGDGNCHGSHYRANSTAGRGNAVSGR